MTHNNTPNTLSRQSIAEQYPPIARPSSVRWNTHNEHREVIKMLADIRSVWFSLYSFGGGDFTNPVTGEVRKDCSKAHCAKQIVRISKSMLTRMRKIGRTPIAGDNTGLKPAWTPKCDKEWEGRMVQRYSLYLSTEALYTRTENMLAEREVEENAISVSELMAG